MPNKNKTLYLGVVFLSIGFLCVLGVVFLMGQANQKDQQKAAALEVKLANMISQKAEDNLPAAEVKKVKRNEIDLEEFLKRAKSIFGEEEMARKEGVLWVDRKSASYVVTLGLINGLRDGTTLEVFDKEEPLGVLKVENALDIISYVKPVGKSMDDFTKDYYRVVVK